MAPYLGLRGKRLNIILSIIAAVAFMLQGYDQAVANGIITLDTFVKTFPEIDTVHTTGRAKKHNSTVEGAVIGLYEVGCAAGALSCLFLGDWLGRRRTIFTVTVIAVVGIIIQSTPFVLSQLIVGRIINGFGVGGITATVPMWVSECSRASERGTMVMLSGCFAVGGLVIAQWLEFGLFHVKGNSVNWRLPIAFQGVFASVVLGLVLFMCESPRWLIKRDRVEDARHVIAVLGDQPSESDEVADEVAMIRFTIADELRNNDSSSPFAMTHNRHLHRTLLAMGVNFFAQMSGISVITFYSTTIIEEDLGYSASTARIFAACIQCWQFISASVAVLLIDRVGRRRMLIGTATGMCIAQFCLAGLSSDIINKNAGAACIFFFFFAETFFPQGFLLVPFMYAAEISPLRVRAKVTALAAATNWLFSFFVAEVSPVAFSHIAWRYYFVYGCIDVTAIVVFYLLYPETKGRSLEEIDQIFIQSKTVIDTVRVAKNMPFEGVVSAREIREIEDEKAANGEHVEVAVP